MRTSSLRLLFLGLTLSGLAPAGFAGPMNQSEIDDLVKRLQTVYENKTSLQANFREERKMAMLKEPLVSEGKFFFTPPYNIRREIKGKQPSTTVINGKKMTIYYPNLQTAELYDLDKRASLKDSLQALTAGLNFGGINNYYNISGNKDGNKYTVTLTPKTAAIRRLFKTVTLNLQEDLTPSHVEVVTTRNEQIDIQYSGVKRNSVDDSEYQFTPPSGTKVTNPFGG